MSETGFWVVAAAMVLAVLAVLIQALRRGAQTIPAQDMPVYRDQLAEIGRDLARGTIRAGEADRLRAEVARRLLDADRSARAAAPVGVRAGAGLVALVMAVVLAASVWGYLRLGAPGYPDLPLQTRLAMADEIYNARPSQAEAEAAAPEARLPEGVDPEFLALMDKLRAAIKTNPTDLRGLDLLARNEAALGNYAAARAAQQALVAAKGDAASAEDLAALAEVMIMAAGGAVSPQAEQALIRALTLDARNGTARYYSGLMFAQVGRPDRSFELWRPLLEEGPADAPWIAPIRAQLQSVADAAGINYALPAAAGPSAAEVDAADVDAAADMTPGDRQAMIRGMVEQLSDRLQSQGGPAADWARLITSLGVLGALDRAEAIYTLSQTEFAGKAEDLATIRAAAVEAGLIQ